MRARYVVLCEDRAQATFVRRFLKLRGMESHEIRVLDLPGRNGGAGEKYVRDRFPAELRAIRDREGVALIAVIDADVRSIADRINQLHTSCTEASVEPRRKEDAAAVLVPKRNIETWFVYLTGGDWVSEETDQWKSKNDDLAVPAANALHEACYREQ